MRIVFISTGSGIHEDYLNDDLLGIEYQILGLSNVLADKYSYEVFIVKRDNVNDVYELKRNLYIVGLSVPSFKEKYIMNKSLSKLIFSFKASKVIMEYDPDVVILVTPYTAYYVSRKLKHQKINKIYVTHITPKYIMSLDNNMYKIHPTRYIEKTIFENVNFIVTLNRYHYNVLSKLGYNVTFIPNGIQIQKYQFSAHKDDRYVFYGGRLTKNKRVDLIIKAYSHLDPEIRKEYKLFLLGEGPELRNLVDLVRRLGISKDVVFIGWKPHKQFLKYLQNATVYVHPSVEECMPVTILEAMGLGKPVVASDIPGINDVIINQYNGILFNPKISSRDLSLILSFLLNNAKERIRLGTNARKTIKEFYTFEKIAEKYDRLFHSG